VKGLFTAFMYQAKRYAISTSTFQTPFTQQPVLQTETF